MNKLLPILFLTILSLNACTYTSDSSIVDLKTAEFKVGLNQKGEITEFY